ncbi:MAG TPA: class I SAM-dependent methyltransferase [Terriglobales bacterium]
MSLVKSPDLTPEKLGNIVVMRGRIPLAVRYWQQRLAYSMRYRGVAGTLEHAWRFLQFRIGDWSFDRRYGVETSERVHPAQFGISPFLAANSEEYRPVPAAFQGVLRSLRIEYPDWVFVDLGAGKGRALFLAAQFPFREIVGVEISSKLVGIARQNIAGFQAKRSNQARIQLIQEDAGAYRFPDSNLLIFLHNPFHGEIMQAVVRNIEAFVEQSGKQVRLIYWNPFHSDLLGSCTRLKLQKRTAHYHIYKSCSEPYV